MIALPPFYNDLDLSLAEALRLITDGVTNRHSAFHQPTVALVGIDGRPRVRTVTLRAFDVAARTLRFHSDIRSDKLPEIARDPRIGIHFYSKPDKVQLRIDGVASVHHTDPIADAAWAGSRIQSRQCYGIEPAQGQALAEGGDYSLPAITEETVEIGRRNFCAVVVSVQSLEWLFLAGQGHRRARFSWVGDQLKTSWLAP